MTPPKPTEDDYTKVHFDFDHLPLLTSPRHALKLRGVALGLIQLPPDQGYTFTHSHTEQEEVYIVVDGAGYLYAPLESPALLST